MTSCRGETLTAAGLEDFVIAVDSQSNSIEFSPLQLHILDEESIRKLIEAPHNSEKEVLSGYLHSLESSATSSPQSWSNVPSTIFSSESHAHQQERQSAEEVEPEEVIYVLLPLNTPITANDWQSENYMNGFETSFPTTTSSNATISNNQQYDFPLNVNSRSKELCYTRANITGPSHSKFTAVSRGEFTVTMVPAIFPSTVPQSETQGIQFSGAPVALDARNLSLPFQKRNKKGPKYGKPKFFLCPFCKYCSSRSIDLKRHVVIHSGEKPYTCHICGKSFSWEKYLRQHIKIHTGLKPYAFSICDKTFTNNSNRTRHILRFHPVECQK